MLIKFESLNIDDRTGYVRPYGICFIKGETILSLGEIIHPAIGKIENVTIINAENGKNVSGTLVRGNIEVLAKYINEQTD